MRQYLIAMAVSFVACFVIAALLVRIAPSARISRRLRRAPLAMVLVLPVALPALFFAMLVAKAAKLFRAGFERLSGQAHLSPAVWHLRQQVIEPPR